MFGPGSAELFARLPNLPGLSADDAKRLLSAAYLDALTAGAEAQRTSGPARADVVSFLRRAAAALESAAVFDTELSPETRSAAAFVAAEALSSIAEVLPLPDAADARLGNIGFDVRVEAGLLYLIAGFDPNAGTITRALERSSPEHGSESDQREWVADLLVALCKLKPGSTRPSARPELARAHSTEVRKAILHELGSCIAQYLVYLQTGGESTLEAIFSRLNRLIKALSSRAAHAGSLADVYHWSRLVAATVAATATRAVVTVPTPAQFAESYSAYLSARARGSRRLRARPLLWPNASEFVQKCLPGPHQNAVVCAPT
jgi:ATP-dependent RNA helicase DOB1